MKYQSRFIRLFAASAILFALTDGVAAEGVGVFGLYRDQGEETAEVLAGLDEDFQNRGCSVHREGEILDVQGSLQLMPVNRFFFLECGRAVLKDIPSRSLFQPLEQAVGALTLFEGDLDVFQGLASPGQGREYIIKISYYTNADPNKRDHDLSALQEMNSERADRYQTEALITPVRAVGITTPDEVAILYYDSPAQGNRFRGANDDILDAIGQFNSDHLVSFTYLTASSER